MDKTLSSFVFHWTYQRNVQKSQLYHKINWSYSKVPSFRWIENVSVWTPLWFPDSTITIVSYTTSQNTREISYKEFRIPQLKW